MAKSKPEAPGVQNKLAYCRASYLYQAARFLARRGLDPDGDLDAAQRTALLNLSRKAASDMRAVSLKAQIRHTSALKRSLCSFCHTLLLEGQTCRSSVENSSRGGAKPWADVLVVKCDTCGNVKRYPVCAPRQKPATARPPPQPPEARPKDATALEGRESGSAS